MNTPSPHSHRTRGDTHSWSPEGPASGAHGDSLAHSPGRLGQHCQHGQAPQCRQAHLAPPLTPCPPWPLRPGPRTPHPLLRLRGLGHHPRTRKEIDMERRWPRRRLQCRADTRRAPNRPRPPAGDPQPRGGADSGPPAGPPPAHRPATALAGQAQRRPKLPHSRATGGREGRVASAGQCADMHQGLRGHRPPSLSLFLRVSEETRLRGGARPVG